MNSTLHSCPYIDFQKQTLSPVCVLKGWCGNKNSLNSRRSYILLWGLVVPDQGLIYQTYCLFSQFMYEPWMLLSQHTVSKAKCG